MVHHNNPENRARITAGLVFDVFTVLDNHGFERAGDDRSVGIATLLLSDLVEGYEGRIDSTGHPRTDQNEDGA